MSAPIHAAFTRHVVKDCANFRLLRMTLSTGAPHWCSCTFMMCYLRDPIWDGTTERMALAVSHSSPRGSSSVPEIKPGGWMPFSRSAPCTPLLSFDPWFLRSSPRDPERPLLSGGRPCSGGGAVKGADWLPSSPVLDVATPAAVSGPAIRRPRAVYPGSSIDIGKTSAGSLGGGGEGATMRSMGSEADGVRVTGVTMPWSEPRRPLGD
mmetsp:Transcript_51809/g.138702  ORF Transcript_51809/g.138702 Transcript_51809/m.138702 type:complete len:208 (-) Transcript_51809:508-1131(-)